MSEDKGNSAAGPEPGRLAAKQDRDSGWQFKPARIWEFLEGAAA
jgi:hypothetical protein